MEEITVGEGEEIKEYGQCIGLVSGIRDGKYIFYVETESGPRICGLPCESGIGNIKEGNKIRCYVVNSGGKPELRIEPYSPPGLSLERRKALDKRRLEELEELDEIMRRENEALVSAIDQKIKEIDECLEKEQRG